jgi:hypothetical protein
MALTAALMLLVGPAAACSSDDTRDIHYGTDAAAEFDLPPAGTAPATDALTADGSPDGANAETSKDSGESADTSPEASDDATTGQ